MSRIPCRYFALCKVAGKTISIFIILVLVSELVVVVILVMVNADHCGHIPESGLIYIHSGVSTVGPSGACAPPTFSLYIK